ncbi:MAG TPA: hypothetical protein VKV57_11795 [bacterium]|nr:hypothetical protein [bacterium]
MTSRSMPRATGFLLVVSLLIVHDPAPLLAQIAAPGQRPRIFHSRSASPPVAQAAVGEAAVDPHARIFLTLGWAAAPASVAQVGGAEDLSQVIDLFRQSLDRLAEWSQLFRQTSSEMLARLIQEFPGQLPDGTDLTDLAREIAALPAALGGALQVVRAKLQPAVVPGSVDERHHAYVGSNPAVAREAVGIAETDQVVAGGVVQQAAASETAAAAAAEVARDLRPQAAAVQARETGDALASSAHDLPSARAGIELLVAGAGASLRQQADLGTATADRLTVLVAQAAEVSQQVGALAATTGALTLRQAEQDRRALDAQLGLADAVSTASQVLGEVLAGAGATQPADIELRPLY